MRYALLQKSAREYQCESHRRDPRMTTLSDIRRRPLNEILSDVVEYNGLVFRAAQHPVLRVIHNFGCNARVPHPVAGSECGTDKSRPLTATIYVLDMALKSEMDEAWRAWVDPNNPPARATVQARLGSVDTLVKIMCVAAKGPVSRAS